MLPAVVTLKFRLAAAARCVPRYCSTSSPAPWFSRFVATCCGVSCSLIRFMCFHYTSRIFWWTISCAQCPAAVVCARFVLVFSLLASSYFLEMLFAFFSISFSSSATRQCLRKSFLFRYFRDYFPIRLTKVSHLHSGGQEMKASFA